MGTLHSAGAPVIGDTDLWHQPHGKPVQLEFPLLCRAAPVEVHLHIFNLSHYYIQLHFPTSLTLLTCSPGLYRLRRMTTSLQIIVYS